MIWMSEDGGVTMKYNLYYLEIVTKNCIRKQILLFFPVSPCCTLKAYFITTACHICSFFLTAVVSSASSERHRLARIKMCFVFISGRVMNLFDRVLKFLLNFKKET